MSEVKITKANFEQEVLNSSVPVLIDFWAQWCVPCQKIGPVLSEIADEYQGKIKVCKVNVDEEEELAADFQVSSIPLLVVMTSKKIINTSIGMRSKPQIIEMIKNLV